MIELHSHPEAAWPGPPYKPYRGALCQGRALRLSLQPSFFVVVTSPSSDQLVTMAVVSLSGSSDLTRDKKKIDLVQRLTGMFRVAPS
jgi:hypothetical protein